jgi:ElaB/YqjD/DUF883 family membrane-anchored ribosome-binding protein
MTQYDYATDPPGGAHAADGGSTTDQVKEQVKEKAQVAQDKARQATGQARGRLREQVDQRSTQAGERVAGTAQDVRSIAEELRRQGKDTPARLAEQAADRAEHVGRYLKGADADRLLADVEDFARRRPWAVVAGGAALGFAASRFLKASSRERYQSYRDGGRDRFVYDYDDQASSVYPAGTGYTSEPVTGTAFTADPTASGSDYATEPAYPEPVDEPLGAQAPPVVGTYDPVLDPDPTATSHAPVDAYDAPATDPAGQRRRADDPEPLT